MNDKKIVVKERINQAEYRSNDVQAIKTNGFHDVGIGKHDLIYLKEGFINIFGNVEIWFANVDNYYEDLKGQHHGKYWAKDWIFININKR